MVSFNTFVAKEYEKTSTAMKAIYGSQKEFKNQYLSSYGLVHWLETMRGEPISLGLCNNIAKVYIQDAGRLPSSIPAILSMVSRLYDIELPEVDGFLTENYWVEKAEKMHWNFIESD